MARLCERLAPNVLLFGTRFNEALPLNLLRKLQKQYPSVKILLIVTAEQTDQALQALAFGIGGILQKKDPLPLLEPAIRALHQNTVWISLSPPSIPPSLAKKRAKLEAKSAI